MNVRRGETRRGKAGVVGEVGGVEDGVVGMIGECEEGER